MRNRRSAAAAVRLKLWLKIPSAGEFVLMQGGVDGSFSSLLPPSFDQALGPIVIGKVTSSWPPSGTWEFNASVTDPATGDLLNEYSTSFVVR